MYRVPSLGRKQFLSTLSNLLPRQMSRAPYSLWLLGFPHLVAAPLDRVPQREHRSFQVISSDAGNPMHGSEGSAISLSLILFSSGATWISEILDLIYNTGDVEKCTRDAIYKRVPFMELIIPRLTNGNFS